MGNRNNTPQITDWEQVDDWEPVGGGVQPPPTASTINTPTLDRLNLSTLDVKMGKGVSTPGQFKDTDPGMGSQAWRAVKGFGKGLGGLAAGLVSAPFTSPMQATVDTANAATEAYMGSSNLPPAARTAVTVGAAIPGFGGAAPAVGKVATPSFALANNRPPTPEESLNAAEAGGELGAYALAPKMAQKVLGANAYNSINKMLGEGSVDLVKNQNAGRGIAREGIVSGSVEGLHTKVKGAIGKWQGTLAQILQSPEAQHPSIHGAEVLSEAFGEPPLNLPRGVWDEFKMNAKLKMDKMSGGTGVLTPAQVHELKTSIQVDFGKLPDTNIELSLNQKAANVRRVFDHAVDAKVTGYEEVNNHLADLHIGDDILLKRIEENATRPTVLEQPTQVIKRVAGTFIGGHNLTSQGTKSGLIPVGIRTAAGAATTPRFNPPMPEFSPPPIEGLSEPSFSDLSSEVMIPGRQQAIPAGPTGIVYDPATSHLVDRANDLSSMAKGLEGPSILTPPPDFAAGPEGGAYPLDPREGAVTSSFQPTGPSTVAPALESPNVQAQAVLKNRRVPPPALAPYSGGDVLPSSGATFQGDTPNSPRFWRGREGVTVKGTQPSFSGNVKPAPATPTDEFVQDLLNKAGNSQAAAQPRTGSIMDNIRASAEGAERRISSDRATWAAQQEETARLTKEASAARPSGKEKLSSIPGKPGDTIDVSGTPRRTEVAPGPSKAEAPKSTPVDTGDHKIGDFVRGKDFVGRKHKGTISRAFPSRHGPAVVLSTTTGDRMILVSDLEKPGGKPSPKVKGPSSSKSLGQTTFPNEEAAWNAAQGNSAIRTSDGKIHTGMDHREIRERLGLPTAPTGDMPTAGMDPVNSGWYLGGKFINLNDLQAAGGSLSKAFNSSLSKPEPIVAKANGPVEWPANSNDRDENYEFFERGQKGKYPVLPHTLLPERFKHAKKIAYSSSISGRALPPELERPGMDVDAVYGLSGDTSTKSWPYDKSLTYTDNDAILTASTADEHSRMTKNLVTLSKGASDKPRVWAHELGHAMWEKDLTQQERDKFLEIRDNVVNQVRKDLQSSGSSPDAPNWPQVAKSVLSKYPQAITFYFEDDVMGAEEAFSELNGQFMANPKAFKSKYPEIYNWYRKLHNREYVQPEKIRSISQAPITRP